MPFIDYKAQQVHYRKLGNGPKTLIAIHGFADSTVLFEPLSTVLEGIYTVYAIDLPYHGETNWQSNTYYPEDLVRVIDTLCLEEDIARFSFICHSMGGRIVLGLLPSLAAKIDTLFFCSAAGFQYTFSESKFFFPRPFRIFVAKLLNDEKRAAAIFNTAHKLGLLNRATHKLFIQQIDQPRRLKRMLYSWTSLVHFPLIAGKRMRKILTEYKIEVHFFTGIKDTITPIKHPYRFKKHYPKATVHPVDGTHFFMKKQLPAYFSALFPSLPDK